VGIPLNDVRKLDLLNVDLERSVVIVADAAEPRYGGGNCDGSVAIGANRTDRKFLVCERDSKRAS
jgi:hypothetical protein